MDSYFHAHIIAPSSWSVPPAVHNNVQLVWLQKMWSSCSFNQLSSYFDDQLLMVVLPAVSAYAVYLIYIAVTQHSQVPIIWDLEYPPLNRSTDFRLFRIEHGIGNTPLRCFLTTTSFASRPEYEALSYEWGPRDFDQRPIYINEKPYKIRKSLYQALAASRRASEDRVFWVDALCINQRHTIEKNHQLRLIMRIYRRAEDVVVWLGPKFDPQGNDGELAISFLKYIGGLDFDRSRRVLNQQGKTFEAELTAVAALCRRTYWNRIWIIQELQSSKSTTLYCGSACIPLETFTMACRFIYTQAGQYMTPLSSRPNKPLTNPKITAIAADIRESLAIHLSEYKDRPISGKPSRLIDWLYFTQTSKSAKPKDRVYALLGLSTDWPTWFEIEYDERKAVEEVYEDVKRMYEEDPDWEAWSLIVRSNLGLKAAASQKDTVLKRGVRVSVILRRSSIPPKWDAADAEYYEYSARVLSRT